MASIGTVKSVTGMVRAIAENGTERMLSVGDTVADNEKIITGDGVIVIAFTDGTVMDLGSNSSIVLNDDVLNQEGNEQTAQSRVDANVEVAALQEALANPNFDPTAALPATGAGPAPAPAQAAGVGGNNGHTVISVDYLNPEAPVEAGFDTVGINNEFLQPDNELPPVIEVDPVVSVSVGLSGESVLEGTSDGTRPVWFIISLDKVFTTDVQVSYQLSPISAINPDDWLGPNSTQTVTIPAGKTTVEVTVDIVEDHFDEGNETFEIILVSAKGGTINPGASSSVITILDDDTSPVANDDAYTTGEDTALIIPVSGVLVNDADADGDVLTTISNTAPSNGSVTLNADGSFTYVPDANFNGTDSFDYTITDGYNAPSTATVTINITPDVPTVNITGSTVEEGNLAKFTVTLSETHETALTVNLSMTNGSADASDYDNTQFFDAGGNPIGNSFTFQAGETNLDVYVQTIDNDPAYGEPLENYTVTAALVGSNTGSTQGGITDSSTPPVISPVISIADAQGTEGNPIAGADDSATFLTFNVSRSGDLSGVSSVSYTVNPGDAATPSDYFGNLSGAVTFAAGSSLETVRIEITDDLTPELTEKFTVTLSSPTGATIGDGNAVGTIFDNNDNSTLLQLSESLIHDTVVNTALVFTAGTDDLTSFKFSTDLSGLLTDSNGIEAGGVVDWTRISDTQVTGSTDGGATTAITLTLSASTISAGSTNNVTVTAVLDDNFKHDSVAGKNSLNLGNIDVVAGDVTGDKATGAVGIEVIDDIIEITNLSNTLLSNTIGTIGHGRLIVDEGEDGLESLVFSGVAPTGLQTLSGESISYQSQADGSLKAIDASGDDVFILSSPGSGYALELKQIFQSSDPSVDNTILDFSVDAKDSDGDKHGGDFQVSFDTNNNGIHSIIMDVPTLDTLIV